MGAFWFQQSFKYLTKKVTHVSVVLSIIIGSALPVFIALNQKTDATVTSHVVINEVFPSPSSGSEWVELYNPTASSVDLTGWSINDDDGHSTAVNGSIAAGSWATFDVTGLNNTGDVVSLNDGSTDVDTVTYPSVATDKSYARIYDGDETFETRASAAVSKNATNGTAPVVAVVNTEEFVANNGSYKGISVGFNVKDFGTVTDVTVDMTRYDGSHVIKHANQGVLDLASNKSTT